MRNHDTATTGNRQPTHRRLYRQMSRVTSAPADDQVNRIPALSRPGGRLIEPAARQGKKWLLPGRKATHFEQVCLKSAMRNITRAVLISVLTLPLILLVGCPTASGPERTDAEREAMRVVRVLRAALAEVDSQNLHSGEALTPEGLCRQVRNMADISGSPRFFELTQELPAGWIEDPSVAPGFHGGYRFTLIHGEERGVYAVPEPPGPTARTVFYAGLPAGFFERNAEGFRPAVPIQPPDVEGDPVWRPMRIIK